MGLAAWGSANCGDPTGAAYAWPVDAEKTGNRVFFINQEGDCIQFDNRAQVYEGLAAAPTFEVAFSNATANNMEEDLGLAVMGFTANDGNTWTSVGN